MVGLYLLSQQFVKGSLLKPFLLKLGMHAITAVQVRAK
jgi:hypothetical protein